MLETGTVIKQEEGKVLICTDQGGSSTSCGGECATCGQNNNKNLLWVYPGEGVEVHPDDKVEIYYPPGKSVMAAFMVLIFPLLLFFLFYFIAAIIFPSGGEMASALAGLCGIVCGFVFNYLWGRLKKDTSLPWITRKIESRQTENE